MRPAHDSIDSALERDELLTIQISPALPCGIAHCGQPARTARIERDSETSALWRLLPICDAHLSRLDASAADINRAPHRDTLTDE